MNKNRKTSFTFKIAESETEFESIHKLNYRTFAIEIPQHDQNEKCFLIDRFHGENTYFIAWMATNWRAWPQSGETGRFRLTKR